MKLYQTFELQTLPTQSSFSIKFLLDMGFEPYIWQLKHTLTR